MLMCRPFHYRFRCDCAVTGNFVLDFIGKLYIPCLYPSAYVRIHYVFMSPSTKALCKRYGCQTWIYRFIFLDDRESGWQILYSFREQTVTYRSKRRYGARMARCSARCRVGRSGRHVRCDVSISFVNAPNCRHKTPRPVFLRDIFTAYIARYILIRELGPSLFKKKNRKSIPAVSCRNIKEVSRVS